MSGSEEEVQVKFGADTGEFSSGVDDVKGKFDEVGDAGNALVDKLSEIEKAIVGAFTVDKIAEFIEKTSEAAEQITRLSDISGFSTDTIQTLQYAIKMTGGDAGAAAPMLVRFNKAISDAAAGSGPAYEAFQKLRVSWDDLKHKSSEDIFQEFLDGLSRINNSSDRAEAGMALVGRGFLNIAAMAEKGRQGFKDYGDDLDKTGDRMSPGTVDKFTKLEESFHRLAAAWEGLGRDMISNMGWLDTIIEKLTKFAEENNAAATAWQNREHITNKSDRDGTDQKAQIPGDVPYDYKNSVSYTGEEKLDRNKEGQQKTAQTQAAEDEKAWAEEAATFDAFQEKMRQGFTQTYDNAKEKDALLVESGKMSYAEMYADLQEALAKEEAATNKSYEESISQYNAEDKQYAQLKQEEANADVAFNTKSAQLSLAASKESAKSWDSAFNTIDKSFDTMLTGVLQGTQTIPQAFERMAGDMIISFTEAIAKMLIRWAALKAATAVNLLSEQQAGSIGGGANNGLMSQLTMGILSLVGIDLVSTAGTDANTTAVAALTVAVTANTTALAVSKAVPSFDVGSPNIPHDMVAQIHQGEMIVPANTAAGVRSGDLSIGGAAGGGVGGDSHTHFHISSMDSAGVAKLLKQHGAAIAAGVAGAARGGNGGLRTALGRM